MDISTSPSRPFATQDPQAGAVVAGVDGTEHDVVVLTAAVAEALRRGAPLHVRYCHEGLDPLALSTSVPVDLSALGMPEQDDVVGVALATVAELDASLTVTSDQPAGRPENLLVEASQNAALVVVGTGRKSKLEELVLGTVALTVAAHGKCPVLVVPHQVDPDGDGDVVVGVDGSDHSQEALAVAAHEARLRETGLVVVTTWFVEVVDGYVVTEPDSPEWRLVEDRIRSMQERLLASVDTDGIEVELRAVRGGIRTTLSDASSGAALVVVGNRGRGGFRSKALGSVTMDLMKRAHCPVLVVHAAADDR